MGQENGCCSSKPDAMEYEINYDENQTVTPGLEPFDDFTLATPDMQAMNVLEYEQRVK